MTKIKTPEHPLSPRELSPNQLHPTLLTTTTTTGDTSSTMVMINTTTTNTTNMINQRNNNNKNHHNHNNNRHNNKPPLTASELRQRQMDREEMQSLLAKLKQLVPGIPKHRRLSKLEIIQHVIDYIFDLQTALEQHPIASSVAASALAAADFVSGSPGSMFVSTPASTTLSSLDSSTMTISCDHYFNNTTNISNGYHHHHQQHTSSPQTLPQRIPGSNRQPLASIVL